MATYVCYLPDGRIDHVRVISPCQLQYAVKPAEAVYMEVPDGADTTGKYVVDGALTDRPEMGLAPACTIGRGQSLHLAILPGATVTVEGVGSETVGETGFDFEAETPDTYTATVSLWPYLDTTITIEVTP